MIYLSPFFFGFVTAFAGLLAPGMLNMTAVRTAIEKGRKGGILFSAGAASVVLLQASIALVFANYINQNPKVLANLKIGAIFVFFVLCIFFFFQARKKFNIKGKLKQGNLFLIGVFMSVINMLAIPFYFGLSTYYAANGQLVMQQPYISLFVVGAALGSFILFMVYVSFASVITKRAKFIATNINYILSGLFLFLAVLTMLKD